MDCTWDIQTTPGSIMQITVSTAAIGISNTCTDDGDYLEVSYYSL